MIHVYVYYVGTLIPNNLVNKLCAVLEETCTEKFEEEYKDEVGKGSESDDDIQEIPVETPVNKTNNKFNINKRIKVEIPKIDLGDLKKNQFKAKVTMEKIPPIKSSQQQARNEPMVKNEIKNEVVEKPLAPESNGKNVGKLKEESKKEVKVEEETKNVKVEENTEKEKKVQPKNDIKNATISLVKESSNGDTSRTAMVRGKKISIKLIEIKKTKEQK